MQLEFNNKIYPINIEYKSNKNLYLRVKDDLNIYIYAPRGISSKEIHIFIKNNAKAIEKMINTMEEKRKRLDNKLLYLGNSYDICYIENKNLIFGGSRVFISRSFNLDKWYKKQAKEIFKQHFDYIYGSFREKIPYPNLKIRSMSSKWGVCNVTNVVVTLNLNLIKLDLRYLDYVIVHELAHLVHANHSNAFWSVVEEYIPNYKQLRKEMKNII